VSTTSRAFETTRSNAAVAQDPRWLAIEQSTFLQVAGRRKFSTTIREKYVP